MNLDDDPDGPLTRVLGGDLQTATFRILVILAVASIVAATIGALVS